MNNIDTPSLVIYKEKLMKNIIDMQSFCDEHSIKLRPMIKTHKIPEIAKLQIENGAIGITCAKIGEAEIMAESGIDDIFIAYEIVTKEKTKRLIDLSRKIRLSVAVDSTYGVDMLNDEYEKNNMSIDVLIEINSGLNRCGLDNLEEIHELASYIIKKPSLNLKGIFTHAGHVYGATEPSQVNTIGLEEGRTIVEIYNYLKGKSIDIEILSTGSTPTAKISGTVEGVNEIRPGNYVFYDAIQNSLKVVETERCALSVIATIVSKPSEDRAIIDAGSKTLGLDKGAHGVSNVSGYGLVKNICGVVIERLSEEHGILSLEDEAKSLKIGDKIEIIPNHACTVINLFENVNVIEEGIVTGLYKVKARGMLK